MASSINPYSLLTQPLQSPLQSSLDSGIRRSNDKDVSRAVNDIGSSLTSTRVADASSPRVDLKAKVESLIDSEVSSGRLTGDQGTQLKTAFDSAFGSGNATAADRPRGAGGPPPGGPAPAGGPPPQAANNNETSTDDTTSTTATSPAETLRQFLKSLQDAADAQALPSYGPPGVTSKPATQGAAPLLLDYRT